jgi:Spy/CpxP family protein refolding chaperone
MAKKLNLTDEQKTQVEQITEASRSKIQPLAQTMKANRQRLQELTAKGQFDEAQVKAIAAEQGLIAAQLIVEKERAKWEIFQILTAEAAVDLAAKISNPQLNKNLTSSSTARLQKTSSE